MRARTWFVGWAFCLWIAAGRRSEGGRSRIPGRCAERIASHTQSWGALGLNTAAYDPGVRPDKAGDPLQIGDRQFAKAWDITRTAR
jgi:hypothetical protein